MKKYGYDQWTESLVSWDFTFHYEGKHPLPPAGAFISENQVEDEMVGCAFMSGMSGSLMMVYSDGHNFTYCLFGVDSQSGMWRGNVVDQDALSKISMRVPICVYGGIVRLPEQMATLCNRFPNSRMYACPMIEELSAFGALVKKIGHKSYRFIPAWENKQTMDAEFVTFDPSLNGDGYGRMADVLSHGMPVVNEIMTTVGVSPFYGKTLHSNWQAGCQVIVRIQDIDSFFPRIPISAKNYAATSVPVRMETTDQFRMMTGYNDEVADVFVATDYVPEVSTFMRFYKTLSAKGFIFASDQDKVMHKGYVPVFRSDKAYRLTRENYEQTKGFIRSNKDASGRSHPVGT